MEPINVGTSKRKSSTMDINEIEPIPMDTSETEHLSMRLGETEPNCVATRETETAFVDSREIEPVLGLMSQAEHNAVGTGAKEITAMDSSEIEPVQMATTETEHPSMRLGETEPNRVVTRETETAFVDFKEIEPVLRVVSQTEPNSVVTGATEIIPMDSSETEPTPMDTSEKEHLSIRLSETEPKCVVTRETETAFVDLSEIEPHLGLMSQAEPNPVVTGVKEIIPMDSTEMEPIRILKSQTEPDCLDRRAMEIIYMDSSQKKSILMSTSQTEPTCKGLSKMNPHSVRMPKMEKISVQTSQMAPTAPVLSETKLIPAAISETEPIYMEHISGDPSKAEHISGDTSKAEPADVGSRDINPNSMSKRAMEPISSSNEIRTVVLLGKTGNGKSATGNSIMGQRNFESGMSMTSVTKNVVAQSSNLIEGRLIEIIDTPGLFDTKLGYETIGKEIVKCIDLAKNGIDAVLVVLSVCKRFSEEEEAAVHCLQALFGSKIFDYVILVFTGGDNLDEKDEDGNVNDDRLHDYLRNNSPDNLQEIIKICGDRTVLFDNKTKDKPTKSLQVQKLFSLVDRVLELNEGESYSHKHFGKDGNTKLPDKDVAFQEQVSILREQIQTKYDEQLKEVTAKMQSTLEETSRKLELVRSAEQATELKAQMREMSQQIAMYKEQLETSNTRPLSLLSRAKEKANEFHIHIGGTDCGIL